MERIEKSHRYLNSIETQYILYILPRRSTKQSHLDAVAKERTLYREVCKESREELKSVFMMNGAFQPPAPNSSIPPRSTRIKVHYSFDMAQQVSIHLTYIIACILELLR